MYVNNPTANFVTQEIWEYTNGTTPNYATPYWVETGVAYGNPLGAQLYTFWADNRPNGGGYNEHDITSISTTLGTSYSFQIAYNGNNGWVVVRDGVGLGTSTSNPGPSTALAAGEEITDTTAQSFATHRGLGFRSTNGNWYTGWLNSTLVSNDPPVAAWISQWSQAEFYSNCAASAPVRQGEHKSMLSKAREMASQNGEYGPQVTTVSSTHSRALAVTSAVVSGDNRPVDVVVMQGNFTGRMAKVPPGGSPPTGKYMTVVFDRATGDVLDWGIHKTKPEL